MRKLVARILRSRAVMLATETDVRDLVVLARVRLARWLAPKRKPPVAVGAAGFEEALKRAGFQVVPLEQLMAPPPAPAAASPSVRTVELAPQSKGAMALPSVETVDRARAHMDEHDMHVLKICRGSKKGCDGRDDQHRCDDCYQVPWFDKRSSAEILCSIERGDA